MIGSVVDLQFLIRRLHEVSGGGLTPYVVDAQGRLVAAATPNFATGQDMKNLDIVRNFVGSGNKAQFIETGSSPWSRRPARRYAWHLLSSNLPGLGRGSYTNRQAKPTAASLKCSAPALLAMLAVLLSVGVSIFAARRITISAGAHPIQPERWRVVTSPAFDLLSRTEIGEPPTL